MFYSALLIFSVILIFFLKKKGFLSFEKDVIQRNYIIILIIIIGVAGIFIFNQKSIHQIDNKVDGETQKIIINYIQNEYGINSTIKSSSFHCNDNWGFAGGYCKYDFKLIDNNNKTFYANYFQHGELTSENISNLKLMAVKQNSSINNVDAKTQTLVIDYLRKKHDMIFTISSASFSCSNEGFCNYEFELADEFNHIFSIYYFYYGELTPDTITHLKTTNLLKVVVD